MSRHIKSVLTALVLLAACGGNGEDGQPPSVEGACASIADALASRASACVGGPADAWRLLLAAQGTTNLCVQVAQGVAADRIKADTSQVQACQQAVAAVDCGALFSGATPAACEAAFAGQVAAGGNCFSEPECSGDATCDTSSTCPGVCVARVAENGSCSDTGPECTAGTTCVSGRCTRESALNGPCGDGQPECAFGLTCIVPSGAQAGTCQGLQQGGPCTADLQCAPKFVCAATGPGVTDCRAAKPAGSACTVGANECEVLTACINSVCRVFPKLGEDCDPSGVSAACLQGFCDPGTSKCVAAKAANAACQGDEECESGTCSNGVCAAACQGG